MSKEDQISKLIEKSTNAAQIASGLKVLGNGNEKAGIKAIIDYGAGKGKNGAIKNGAIALTAGAVGAIIVYLLNKKKLNKKEKEIVVALEKSLEEDGVENQNIIDFSDSES